MTMEAVKGEEFITYFQETADLQPSHCAMLPFARNVFDPMDFTPMVLDSIQNLNRKTTLAFELALPSMFLSGIQHIAEIPEGISKQPTYVVDYLKDIPTNWDETKFIDGYPGKFIVMARKKDEIRHLVGINGENGPKEIEIDMSFVTGKKGILITEDENGFKLENLKTTGNTKLTVKMKSYGRFVAKF